MAKSTIKLSDIGGAIAEQLTLYHADVIERVNAAGEKAVRSLVKKTKATAPKQSGDYRKAITSITTEHPVTRDKTFTWGAKAPHYRLTHLLVKGHAKKGGGRVDGDPFLENALAEVLPAYEAEIEEALMND